MTPTEDTPTNPKVPDSIKGTGYYTPMDLVPEEPAAVQQDDKLTAPQSPKTGAIPSQSDNSGAMQQLRETEITERQCRDCLQVLPLDKLKKNNTCPGGRESLCKDCDNKRTNRYYANHQEAKMGKVAEYRKTDRGKAVLYKINAKQIKENPLKAKARAAVRYAVLAGKLVKPTACPKCGQEKRIEAHHTDYSKPLDVMWLCSYCHKEEHGVLIWQK